MDYKMEKVGAEALDEIYEMLLEVREGMDHKEWFFVDKKELMKQHLEEKTGLMYRVYDANEQKTTAIFYAVLPGMTEENLGFDVGFSEQKLPKVAIMDTAAVRSGYRGMKFQYKLMQMAEEDLRKMGYQYLMCTVHPENTYSLNNVKNQGYELLAQKEKYGGVLRCILCKEL